VESGAAHETLHGQIDLFPHTNSGNFALLDGHTEIHRGVRGNWSGTWRSELKWFPNSL